ncbi:MAG: bifunctional [glutamate--ammonia ligase]-adenylyl-L-tyrosine phosphorylase/[glutamate--ammonia-ligase] adenylyltransferase [Halioglobus sp.]
MELLLAPTLLTASQTAWDQILEQCDASQLVRFDTLFADETLHRQRQKVLACSPFVAEQIRRRPELLLSLLESGELQERLTEEALLAGLQSATPGNEDESLSVLRQYRQRHMVRIIWRDLCRLADTTETTRDTSLLAEACITFAQNQTMRELELRYGKPRSSESGNAQQMIVLAMGKLGARELNVSSDIDLIFAYPCAGNTDGDEKSLSNEEFFTQVGRGVINLLDKTTADGFVFRVDMRLRPYGDSGALVHNFASLESYYQEQGRDWERYAMIKARPITGDLEDREALMASLQPFVYRKYVDFGVIDSLRSMKQMIAAEEHRRGLQNDIKLGPGGIREIEFIAQCFQLIRGGRDLQLQQRELLPVLSACVELGILPAAAESELRMAYLFLRDTEHALQGFQDRQTQALPTDDYPQLALANAMHCATWAEYVVLLDSHRDKVREHFANLIADPDEESNDAAPELVGIWGEHVDVQVLASIGYQQPEASSKAIVSLHNNPRIVALQSEGRERLDQFIPRLVSSCAEVEHPDLALQRVLPLVLAIARRSVYLAMLLENPPALTELVLLCSASPWISDQLEHNPVLLDELLDRASLYTAPDKNLLRDELRQQVSRLPLGDLEAQMDALRYFKASHVLRVAASELVGRLPLMKVSDKLTWIAEVILEQVLAVAWADLTGKYGNPASANETMGFAVYAYGKLGGIELGYGSDLDLVFIYQDGKGSTDGERSIDNAVFYTRLGQRLIHILETRMYMGQMNEVDMRLRPSGSSGMLVSTVGGFRHYQQTDAWTWEHQALVRARFVAGDESLAREVDQVREDVLRQTRNEVRLAEEVCAMRSKMRRHLLPDDQAQEREFDLKQGVGGIVDIEFMVQYAVLAWSANEPELVRWSDNVRILQTLGREGFFKQPECEALTQAYLAYRSAAHQLSLQQSGAVPADQFVAEREAVTAKWVQLFGDVPGTQPTAGDSS